MISAMRSCYDSRRGETMNLTRYIWRNALRNKRRAGLTILSIGFSLFLLLALLTFLRVLLHPQLEEASALRLVTARSTSIAEMMPISYLDKIKRVPGVAHVTPLQWFNGIYRDPTFQFANFAVDPRTIWDVYVDQKVTPEERAAFISNRMGAVAGEDLAKRFDWKVGDRITLKGTIFPVDLDLEIVGIFTAPLYQNALYFQYDYFNEALDGINAVGCFVIKATDTAVVPQIAKAIDDMFRNSPAETKTDSEKAFVLGFISMLGNIQVIIGSIAGVVVFTMLLVAVSTMAMTVRERLREVAILKTLGYSRRVILGLVIAEAEFISMIGLAIGLVLGESLRLLDLERITQGFILRWDPSWQTYVWVVTTGVAIGLISGFFPAWQAANMTITGAMRNIE